MRLATSFWFLRCLVVWSGLFLLVSRVSAKEASCTKLFDAKRYLDAADCFERLSSLPLRVLRRSQQHIFKDRYLRHAAIALIQAARQRDSIEESGFFKEKAIQLLKRSFEAGYCEAAERCRNNRLLADRITQEIGYTSLIVDTRDLKAKIDIRGYRFHHEQMHTFMQALRPGRYTITIEFSRRKRIVRQVNLRKGHTLAVQATTTQLQIVEKKIIVAKAIPPIVLGGYILGGSLMAVGGGLLVYGLFVQGDLNAQMLDPDRNAKLSDQAYHQGFEQAKTLLLIGWLSLGVGAAALATGIILHLAGQGNTHQGSAHSPRLTPLSFLRDRPSVGAVLFFQSGEGF